MPREGSSSSSSSRSHLVVGSLRHTILLQPVQSWTSSFAVPMALMFRLTQSIHLCFGLPRFLLPGGTISRVFLPTYSWSRLLTWPNNLKLAFLYLSVMFSTSIPDVIVSHMHTCTSSFLSPQISTHGSYGTVSILYSIAG